MSKWLLPYYVGFFALGLLFFSYIAIAGSFTDNSPSKVEIENMGAFKGCYEVHHGKYPTCTFRTSYGSNYSFTATVPLDYVYGATDADSVIVTTKYSRFGSTTHLRLGNRESRMYDCNIRFIPVNP
jgi:hypothetical protein